MESNDSSAGPDPLQSSTDRDALLQYLEEHPEHAAGLRHLARDTAARGASPLNIDAETLRSVVAASRRRARRSRVTSGTELRHRLAVWQFYRVALERGRVPPELAIAAGVEPLDAVPQLGALRRFASARPASRASMELLARFLCGMGTGLEAVTAQDLDRFRRQLESYERAAAYRHAHWLRRLCLEEARAGRVGLGAAVAAGVDPLEISPGRRELTAYLKRHPHHRASIRRLIGFLLRRGTNPLTATDGDLNAFLRDGLAGLAPATRANSKSAMRCFYRERANRHR